MTRRSLHSRASRRALALAAATASLAATVACANVLGIDALERTECSPDCGPKGAPPKPPPRDDGADAAASEPEVVVVSDAKDADVDGSFVELPTDAAPPPRETASFISPNALQFGGFARVSTWTISSLDPSTIHYTLDGTVPSRQSPSGPSPLLIANVPGGALIRWFSDTGAAEPPRIAEVNVNVGLQADYGYVVEGARFDGKGAAIVARPGQTLSFSLSIQIWSAASCPGCILQFVYGLENTTSGCLFNGTTGPYPGVQGKGTAPITAPATPGIYKVRVGHMREYTCGDAVASNPLGAVANGTEVAILVVR